MDLVTVVGNQLDVPCGLKDVFCGECHVHLLVCPKGSVFPAAPGSTFSLILRMPFFLGQKASSVVKTSLRALKCNWLLAPDHGILGLSYGCLFQHPYVVCHPIWCHHVIIFFRTVCSFAFSANFLPVSDFPQNLHESLYAGHALGGWALPQLPRAWRTWSTLFIGVLVRF